MWAFQGSQGTQGSNHRDHEKRFLRAAKGYFPGRVPG